MSTELFQRFLDGPRPVPTLVTVLLAVSVVILVPWIPFAFLATGMAFEGKESLDSYLCILSVWSYPTLVCIAYIFRRRRPELIWLPLLTVLPFLFEEAAFRLGIS